MRILRILLPLFALLMWSATTQAQDDSGGHTLTTRCIPAEGGRTSPESGTYASDASVTVNCYANTGFRFLQWEDEEGNVLSTSTRFNYTMPAQDVTLIARLEYAPTLPTEPSVPDIKTYATVYMSVTPSNGGYIRKYGEYTEINESEAKYVVGSTARLDANSNSGFRFVNWTENGETVSTSSSLSFTVEEGSRNLVANFEYEPGTPSEPGTPVLYRKLTLNSNPATATSSLRGAGEYAEGREVNVSAVANEYYIFENWTDDSGNIVSDAISFTYTIPTRHVTLTANFRYEYNYDPSTPSEPGSPDNDDNGVTARPRIDMFDDTHVMMLSSTAGATIHYTLDGTEPTTSSSVYSNPVFVPSNLVVKAMAVKDGLENSPVTTYQVTAYHAAAPVFTFKDYKVEITSATPGAIIHYNIGRTDPTEESPIYQEPLGLNDGDVVRAIAYADNLTPSEVSTFVFQKSNYILEAPVITKDADGRIVITVNKEGCTIRYTTDGTEPTISSAIYSGPLSLDGNFTVKAYTTHPDFMDSPVAEYVLDGFKVERPELTFADRVLSMSVATEGASIRYTLDGSEPTETSALYSQPLDLTEDCTVRAMGFKDNYEPSETAEYIFVYADHQVAKPEVGYDPERHTVTMTCATENASIRYTTNGDVPTATTGLSYSGPFTAEGNATYTVRAFRNDMFDSEVTTLEIDDQTVPTPSANFANKRLTLNCPDPEATIYYTTDGSEPDSGSTRYTGPVELTEDCPVYFIAIREGYNDSEVAYYEFHYAEHQVAQPTAEYDPGSRSMTMACDTEDASIRYTTNGRTPTATTGVAYSGPFAVEGNKTFTIRAFRNDLFDSEVTTLEVNDQTVPTPTASFANRRLTLTCPDPEATIYYTLDGNEPTASSTRYTGAIELTESCIVTFIGVREGFNNSDVAYYEFNYPEHQVAQPMADYNPETRTVTMTCVTENASIRYTTDGRTPTATTGVSYSGPFAVEGNKTFTIRAFRNDLFDSEVTTLEVNDQTVPTPTASFANKRLTLTCSDAEATIYYTTDGSAPSASSTRYTGAVELTETCTVLFVGVREGFNNSEVGYYDFIYAEHQAAQPEVAYDPENRIMTMFTETENASIRYTTNGQMPTATTGVPYSAPFAVEGNQTFTVRAFRNDLFDSEATVFTVDDQTVPTPTASFANRRLTLSCSDQEATIYYTTDGSEPTSNSTRYTGPVELTEDCPVYFIAIREGFNESEVAYYEFRYAEHQVAQPEVSYDRETRTMTMACATEGASIRYTTNVEGPTATTGIAYSRPFTVEGNMAFTVRAFRNDLFDSEVTIFDVNDQRVPTPTATFANRRLTLTCSDPEATIYYSTDGGELPAGATRYTGAIELTESCTVSFIGVREGFNNSETGYFEFRKHEYQAATPVMDYDTDSKTLTMTCTTEGATIRYTSDGTVPTATTGTPYSGPITVDGNHTYTAVAFAEGLYDSEAATLTIDSQKVPTPTASFANKVLTLTCPDAEATIYYTTDGSAPSASSTRYTGAVELTETCTVLFVGVRDGFNNSEVGYYDFIYAEHQVAQPEVSYDPETRTMTMTCATEGASIRYTNNVEGPTATTGIAYSRPFTVEGNMAFTVRAFRNDLFDSEVTIFDVNDQRVPTPTATFANRRLTLTCSDPEATIYYSTDGGELPAGATRYTGAIELTESCTVSFIGVREGFNNSETGYFEFRKHEYQAATPVMDYDTDSKTLTMTCTTEGATIRYTSDGTVPTATTGTPYSGPITVDGNHTYTAVAFAEGLFDSEAATLTIDSQKVPTPTATFANKVLTLTCPDGKAEIHYTLDNTEPTASSTLYTAPIALTSDCTVYFLAVREGYNDSDMASFDFVRGSYTVAIPTISYDSARSQVTMGCATQGATIRYTTDGTVPTATTGTVYTAPVAVSGNHTFTAVAFADGLFDSEAATLTINDQAVPTPTASFANRRLTLSCSDPEATIYYTTDGSEPTANSTRYTGPVELPEDCAVRFIAMREGFHDSEVVYFEFSKANYQAATPYMQYDTGSKVLTMTCDTEGASIRYTTDGTIPTATTGTPYSGPITVEGNHTFTVRAFRNDLFDSEVTVFEVNDQKVPTPTASFANKVLTLTCPDAEAEIHYTLDSNAPTASSTLYSGPVALTSDCTVLFIALREGYNDSDIASFEFVRGSYTAAAPTFSYDPAKRLMSIATATEGAEIRYTTDGSTPTATTGNVYTQPIAVEGNLTFKAIATRSDLFESTVSDYTVTGQKAPTPTASYSKKKLTLTCSDAEAAIFYTLDADAPKENWTRYSAPIDLTGDCTVSYFARVAGYGDSDTGTYTHRTADHRTATPTFDYDTEALTVGMACATDGAIIRYTTDGSVPTETTGTLYTAAVRVEGNQTFTAVAFHSDYYPSAAAVLRVSDQQVPTPTASFTGRTLVLSCADRNAAIHYTTDGSAATASSTRYSTPITLDGDCTVHMIAVRAGYDDSEQGIFEFHKADYMEAIPTVTPDYRGRILTINQTRHLQVLVSIDGSTETMATPATIEVRPGMKGVSATAIAANGDRYDSETATFDIVFHSAPALTYDGHTLSYAPAADEADRENARTDIYLDGVLRQSGQTEGSLDITGFATASAVTESDHAFRSEESVLALDYYNTGRIAGARNGHRLTEGFGTWGDSLTDYGFLQVKGEVEMEDLVFIATLPSLRTLHLDPERMSDASCDRALAGSGIETIYSASYPAGMLKDMPRLTTVLWGGDERMPEGRVTEAGNPNILVWVSDATLAPADAVNVVEHDQAEGTGVTDPDGASITGTSEHITLQAGYPFNAHMPIEAESITLTKEFTLPTVIGECAGWETITLPFTPESIMHEKAGAIVPFNVWTGEGDPRKPYWLYRATESGWEAADSIEATTPYLISMPNSIDYVEEYRLPGKVTFAATDVTLGVEESLPTLSDWVDGIEFVGTFMPVEETGIRSLNVNRLAGLDHLGSAFIEEDTTLPFGAYLRGESLPRRIPVFGDWSGVMTPAADAAGLTVESPAPGMIRISSSRALRTAIVTPEGSIIRTVNLRADESMTVEGLTRGLYIAGGVKIMVR